MVKKTPQINDSDKSKVYILLDGSGSMENSWQEMLNAINVYVKELDKNISVSLSVFSALVNGRATDYATIRDCTAGEWVKLSRDEVAPHSATPLFDSMARTLWRVIDESKKRAIFMLVTDGYENASRKFNKIEVGGMIDAIKRKDYEVIFLGANFDGISGIAQDYNIASNKFMNFTPVNFTSSMSGLARSTQLYTSAPMGSAAAESAFNLDEKTKAAAVR